LNVSRILPPGVLAKTQIGSPLYTSPEIWNSENGYNEKCDIWSLGVVIYELCTLKVPFEASSIEELIRKLKTQRLKNIPNGYSPALN
jgi:serine/threonine protein kinase